MKTICIRVDGNKEIATGHLGRCLSIAQVFNSPHTDNIIPQNPVIFIVSDENSKKILAERFEKTDNFQIVVLNTSYKNMEEELPSLKELLLKLNCGCLLIDSYFVTEKYLNSLHNALKECNCRLAYLDDLQKFSSYDLDIIINYGVNSVPKVYEGVSTKLIGSKYTPLRAQFGNSPYLKASDDFNIFISSGGIDTQNMSASLINAINHRIDISKKISFYVLTSKLNSHFDELTAMAENNDNIKIFAGITNVADIMKQCNIAISAGGTTLSELCALGIPTVSYLNADNQKAGIEEFNQNGIIPFAGDVTDENKKDAVIDNILNTVNIFINSSDEKIRNISDKMRSYIDGKGAQRIAKELAK